MEMNNKNNRGSHEMGNLEKTHQITRPYYSNNQYKLEPRPIPVSVIMGLYT